MSQIVTGTAAKVYRNTGTFDEPVWEEANIATGQPGMSADEVAFLAKIIADPEDDTVRLVFADWLQENGREERAEFIRLQCRIATAQRGGHGDANRLCPVIHYALTHQRAGGQMMPSCERCVVVQQWQYREQELIQDHGYGWCDGLVGNAKTRGISKAGPTCVVDYIFPTGRGTNAIWLTFVRGFIEKAEMPAACWLAHGDAIRAAHPVTRVVLTNAVPALEWLTIGGLIQGFAKVRIAGRVVEVRNGATDKDALEARWPGVTFDLPP